MRVLINGLAALKPKTGVGHHLANLTQALLAGYTQDEFLLYPGARLSQVIRSLNRPAPRTEGIRRPSRLRQARATGLSLLKSTAKAACRFHFSAYSQLFPADLYHEPNFVPFPSRLPTVVTVHDLSVMRFPQWHPSDRVLAHERRFLRGLEQATHVIVVSEAIRREMLGDLGFPGDRVTTVYNGISAAYRPLPPTVVEPVRARLGLPARYFLCVGTIEPRKNLGTVMRAFTDLPPAVRNDCPLVLVGSWGWKSEPDRDYFDRVGRPAGIQHLGYVADEDLPAVYRGATALLYPSYYEGFGLPPIEMLACGGAVVASTAEALREVCGSHAAFVEPDDQPGWRAAMLRLATEPEYGEMLRRGGPAHAAQFTWERAARETVALYRRVLGLPREQTVSSSSAA